MDIHSGLGETVWGARWGVGVGSTRELAVLSFQFFCKLNTALKKSPLIQRNPITQALRALGFLQDGKAGDEPQWAREGTGGTGVGPGVGGEVGSAGGPHGLGHLQPAPVPSLGRGIACHVVCETQTSQVCTPGSTAPALLPVKAWSHAPCSAYAPEGWVLVAVG